MVTDIVPTILAVGKIRKIDDNEEYSHAALYRYPTYVA